jgi:phosphorylcholine metabolism protein LicD
MNSKNITQEDKEILYDYINVANSFVEILGIPLFAVGGTLLGIVRDGGLIPWDDDLDYAFLEDLSPKIESEGLEFLNQKGYFLLKEDVHFFKFVYHIARPASEDMDYKGLKKMNQGGYWDIVFGKNKKLRSKNDLFMDLFPYIKKNNGFYDSSGKNKTREIKEDEWLVTKYECKDFYTYSIREYDRFLTRRYGDYRKPVRWKAHRKTN